MVRFLETQFLILVTPRLELPSESSLWNILRSDPLNLIIYPFSSKLAEISL